MPIFKTLGDRMKHYEKCMSPATLCARLPIIVRLDGRSFHSITKKFNKPFDEDFIKCMQKTTQHLVNETNAKVAYIQSDEISLILRYEDYRSQAYFDGKRDKINSVLSSLATLKLYQYMLDLVAFDNKISPKDALFDCRCFNVPSVDEAFNYIVWREQDAVRNSIQALGQSKFSHKQLDRKSCTDIQDMLVLEHGINWNDLDQQKKNGSFYMEDDWQMLGRVTSDDVKEYLYERL